MKFFVGMLLLILALSSFAQETTVMPFETDGCTGYMDGTFDRPSVWRHCCVKHDLSYWAGGTVVDREAVDKNLKTCAAQTGHSTQASIMYFGVRIGSVSPVKFGGKQWGNGWSKNVLYEKLSVEKIDLVQSELEKEKYESLFSWKEVESFISKLRERN